MNKNFSFAVATVFIGIIIAVVSEIKGHSLLGLLSIIFIIPGGIIFGTYLYNTLLKK